MNDRARHLEFLWFCAFPLVAAGCGGESPTEGPEVEVVEGSLLGIAGDKQVGTLGRPLSDSLIVEVADASGNVLPGVTVEWSVAHYIGLRRSGGAPFNDGIVSPATVVTDAAGLAKVLWTLGLEAGSETATLQAVTASASVSDVGRLTFTFTATTASLVPLTDMGTSTYFGFTGGLYPGGNVMPQAHTDAGQAFATAVEPLDTDGNPTTNGQYGLLSIGYANTLEIFCGGEQIENRSPCPSFSFMGKAETDPEVLKTDLTIVNGAIWRSEPKRRVSPTGEAYDTIRDERLSPRGLSEQQVQVVWMQAMDREPTGTLPDPGANAHALVRRLGDIMRALRSRYPNLRLVFLTSRMFGGTTLEHDRIKEPYSYESGFAMKWLIQAQIDQMASGGTIVDERAGDLNYNTVAPWIGWGPYFWADGGNPRSDGHFWAREDLSNNTRDIDQDLSELGREKAANLLLDFFKTSPHARCWFVTGETC